MKISLYFDRSEFTCHCGCGFDTVDTALIKLLDIIRLKFGAVTITSGARCKKYNKKIGGYPSSQHLVGKAADIKVLGIAPEVIQEFVDTRKPDQGGLGRYDTFTHVDVRDSKARWSG